MLELEQIPLPRSGQITKVNFGCPIKCSGWTCVDRRGNPPWDIYDWLEHSKNEDVCVSEIRTKNLLEHLPDPGRFLTLCYDILLAGGKIDLITDNAEFFPFYLPFWVRRTGVGAHSVNQYAIDHCNSIHFMIFTSMHLRNLLERAGFRRVSVRRTTFGARLQALGFK